MKILSKIMSVLTFFACLCWNNLLEAQKPAGRETILLTDCLENFKSNRKNLRSGVWGMSAALEVLKKETSEGEELPSTAKSWRKEMEDIKECKKALKKSYKTLKKKDLRGFDYDVTDCKRPRMLLNGTVADLSFREENPGSEALEALDEALEAYQKAIPILGAPVFDPPPKQSCCCIS